jgi:hypothetical protein
MIPLVVGFAPGVVGAVTRYYYPTAFRGDPLLARLRLLPCPAP